LTTSRPAVEYLKRLILRIPDGSNCRGWVAVYKPASPHPTCAALLGSSQHRDPVPAVSSGTQWNTNRFGTGPLYEVLIMVLRSLITCRSSKQDVTSDIIAYYV
ncbi:unnamed protein product, partial [Staurois parvus]